MQTSLWKTIKRSFRAAKESLGGISTYNKKMAEFLSGGTRSDSGVIVTERTALYSTTVLACQKVIAESIASLPLMVYQRQERGKERAYDHPLYGVLHDQANPYMTSFLFRETLQHHLLTYGNAYCEIQRNASGNVVALWPLLPDRTVVKLEGDKKYYQTNIKNETVTLPSNRVLHIPGLGFDGLQGYSPIQMAMQAIGLGMAAEEFGARFYGNGMNVGAVAEHPGKLTEQGSKNLRESLEKTYSGLGKSHRLLLLEEGMQFKRVPFAPNEAQFLETRKFQVNEIARLYRVPPHLIQDLDRATFSNIEYQSIEFVVHTLRPWLVRWEQAILTQLFTAEERKQYFAEFLVDGLLRGDMKSRYDAYAVGRSNGWLSADDIRALENMNPLPEKKGEIYLVPLNMVPVDYIMDQPQAQQEPSEENNGGKRDLIAKEKRQRAVATRERIMQAWKPVYRDAFSRIVRREKNDMKRLVHKHIRSVETLREAIEKFYDTEGKFRDYILQVLRPVQDGLSEQIMQAAAEEVNDKADPEQVKQFNERYLQNRAQEYVDSSKGQLLALTEEDEEEMLGLIDERLDDWEQNRPDKVIEDEVHRAGNAVARTVWLFAGIQIVRWVTMGANPCEFCQMMDGRTVSITKAFVDAGTDLQGSTGESHFSVYESKLHPPLHRYCVCGIAPGI